jgi:hypothetical protein
MVKGQHFILEQARDRANETGFCSRLEILVPFSTHLNAPCCELLDGL